MLWVGAGGVVGRDVEGVGILEWVRSAASGWVPPRGVSLFPCCRGLAGVEFIKGTFFFSYAILCAHSYSIDYSAKHTCKMQAQDKRIRG
jgi:hypothetical protein